MTRSAITALVAADQADLEDVVEEEEEGLVVTVVEMEALAATEADEEGLVVIEVDEDLAATERTEEAQEASAAALVGGIEALRTSKADLILTSKCVQAP